MTTTLPQARHDGDAVQTTAWQAYDLGMCVLPPAHDGTKRPDVGEWKHYQTDRPTPETMQRWYGEEGERRDGVGLLCGHVSNDLVTVDFDDAAVYTAVMALLDAPAFAALRAIIERIRAGYEERTPKRGCHWLVSCPGVATTKLAMRPNAENPSNRDTLIEVKGEGGYVVIAPSGGRTHPSGGSYELLSGGLDSIAAVTPLEFKALAHFLATFDEMPEPKPEVIPLPRECATGELRPGDDYNLRGDWHSLLARHGWTYQTKHGSKEYYKRPGKIEPGHSAVVYQASDGLRKLAVYSTSTPFTAHAAGERNGHSLFRAYALLDHDNDFTSAARALRQQGYGRPPAAPTTSANVSTASTGAPMGQTAGASDMATAPPFLPLTDSGNAERLVARHGTIIRYSWQQDSWYVWNGRHWEPDQTGRMEQLAKDTVRAIPEEAAGREGEAYTKVLKWAAASEAIGRRKAMITLARSEPGISVQPHELDADPWLLGVRNGTIDLRTGALRPHDRRDLITRLIGVDYDPDADCPRFEAFLTRIFDNKTELISYVQRLVGYALTGSTSEQLVIIAHGFGSNGKSTLTGALRRLLGPYAADADADSFMERRTDSIREDIAALDGVRFVAASETGDGKRLSEALVKKMTGGERLRARRLYENGYEFQPQFKVWLSTNHRPDIRGTDHAIWRRIRLIPFTVTIPDAERDRDLSDTLMHEYPGILAWAIRGCLEWQRIGEAPPDVVVDATTGYRQEQDIIAAWLEDRCIQEPGARERPKRLYDDYYSHCTELGEDPIKQRTFWARLTEHGFIEKKSNGTRYRTGIRLQSALPRQPERQQSALPFQPARSPA